MKTIVMIVAVPDDLTETQIGSLMLNLSVQCEAYHHDADPAQDYPAMKAEFWR